MFWLRLAQVLHFCSRPLGLPSLALLQKTLGLPERSCNEAVDNFNVAIDLWLCSQVLHFCNRPLVLPASCSVTTDLWTSQQNSCNNVVCLSKALAHSGLRQAPFLK